MPRRFPLFPVLLLALPLAAQPGQALASGAPTAVALPDTGLFEPVASQYRARLQRLGSPGRDVPAAERVALLIATGQLERADSVARPALDGSPSAELALGRARLARQDFANLASTMDRLEAREPLTPAERSLLYAWRLGRDDEAGVDSLAHAHLAGQRDPGVIVDLLAAARVAYDVQDYARAESLDTRALAAAPAPARRARPAWGDSASERRGAALVGLALVQQKRRDWDRSLATLREALAEDASADALMALTETLIRLGRTDEATSAAEWAVRLAPCDDAAHYLLGNGYARRNYTQLHAAYPAAFADAAGRGELARADGLLAAGRRAEARAAYGRVIAAHPLWADARVRLASLDFEDGRFAQSREGCVEALRACPEYGRAHAVLAKALEGQRFEIDVHRAAYEMRFASTPMPDVPGIERFVVNWKSLSPRHQKRVALSIAPWKAFVPVLVEGGATFYIKPMYMLLSECPEQETLHDQRISYDSRLWDDVRGCGGYHTVTGIEDVERTIFDRYNTVLHELTHQVHAVLPADDGRAIQELYRRAKERDDATKNGFLSRYAGGSVFEYVAEGANALGSPRRDAYDPREVVRERLDAIDPDLRRLVERFEARTDVSASYPIAYAAGGDDRVERGRVAEALPLYAKALGYDRDNETALVAQAHAMVLGGLAAEAESVAAHAVRAHPSSGPARVAAAEAAWFAGRGPAAARAALEAARTKVRREDRDQVELEIGRLAWNAGDAPGALAAYDSVLATQSDDPDGMQGRAAALALARRWDEAFAQYDKAVRMRTGIVDLRCDYARDLLRAGRVDDARAQLDAARLLDESNARAEALRAWANLAAGDLALARTHARQALAWGPWCDLAVIVEGAVESRAGSAADARAEWAKVDERLARRAPPAYVYRPSVAAWELVHALPALETGILESFRTAGR